MDLHLNDLFSESARIERYNTSRSLFSCRMQEGSSVSTHVLKIIRYIERLEALGFTMDNDLYIDLVLQSLPESYKGFILNFNMNQLERSLPDLLNMLRVAEKDLKKAKAASPILFVNKTKKRKGKEKSNENNKTHPKKKQRKGHQKPASNEKDAFCFECDKKGH